MGETAILSKVSSYLSPHPEAEDDEPAGTLSIYEYEQIRGGLLCVSSCLLSANGVSGLPTTSS